MVMKFSGVVDVKALSVYGDISDESLDTYHYKINEFSNKLCKLLKLIDEEINSLKYFPRIKANKDFVKMIGISLIELEQFIKQISQLSREIQREINISYYEDFDYTLRTYKFKCKRLKEYIDLFNKYRDKVDRLWYIKDSKKKAIKKTVEEFIEVSEELYTIIDILYSHIVI